MLCFQSNSQQDKVCIHKGEEKWHKRSVAAVMMLKQMAHQGFIPLAVGIWGICRTWVLRVPWTAAVAASYVEQSKHLISKRQKELPNTCGSIQLYCWLQWWNTHLTKTNHTFNKKFTTFNWKTDSQRGWRVHCHPDNTTKVWWNCCSWYFHSVQDSNQFNFTFCVNYDGH